MNVSPRARTCVADAVAESVDDAAAFAADLVAERSVQGHEGGAQAIVRDHMEELGLDVHTITADDIDGIRDHPEFTDTGLSYEDRPNVVGELASDGDGRSLLFNGHIDVVPEGDANQWSFDPFAGVVENGRILGRGASDMKGGIAAMLTAIEAIRDAGFRLRGDLRIESVIEEEAGGFGGSLATTLHGNGADAVVIPEPTDFDIWIANVGVSYFRVTVEGKGAHAAETDNGVNAITKLYPIVQALSALHDDRKVTVHDERFEQWHDHTVSLNIGTLRGGEWPSNVPDEAVLGCRVSHAPAETREEIHWQVEQTVVEAAEGDPWLEEHPPAVEWFGWRGSSSAISPDEPIVRTIQDVMAESGAETPAAKGFPGGIDTRFFVNYADTPAVCFGPGANNIHGTDEYLPVADLERLTTALALIAMEWCGYEDDQ